jgi:hypothetical protein
MSSVYLYTSILAAPFLSPFTVVDTLNDVEHPFVIYLDTPSDGFISNDQVYLSPSPHLLVLANLTQLLNFSVPMVCYSS